MSMSRKDYVKFANMLSELAISADPTLILTQSEYDNVISLIQSIMIETANIFEADNPNFDRARFYAACGFSSDGTIYLGKS